MESLAGRIKHLLIGGWNLERSAVKIRKELIDTLTKYQDVMPKADWDFLHRSLHCMDKFKDHAEEVMFKRLSREDVERIGGTHVWYGDPDPIDSKR